MKGFITRLVTGVVSCMGIVSSAAAVDVPSGFVVENAAPGASFDTPVAIAFLPSGRMLVAEKRGRLYVVKDGVKHSTPLWSAESEVLNMVDRGLLDVAVDPNYATNHYLYLLYTVDAEGGDGPTAAFGRLSRYQVSFSDSNALVSGSRTVLMGASWPAGPCSGSPSHTIGALRWGTDGSLLVSTGDGASFDEMDEGGLHPDMFSPGRTDPYEDIGSFRSQSLSSLAGKVLRINPANGLGYSSNPYYDGNANSPRSKVWAYGLRNPFRFTVKPGSGSADPGTGNPGIVYLGDVGWRTWEELNIVTQPGQNFGWPCHEGMNPLYIYQYATPGHNGCDSFGTPDNPAPARAPTSTWEHGLPELGTPPGLIGSCSVGGVFYTGGSYPALYQNRYFFADFVGEWIDVLVTDANHNLVQVLPFATQTGAPVDLVTDPLSGDLFYVSISDNEIRRVRYTGSTSNSPPFAVMQATPTAGLAPLAVSFTSTGSYDPDDDPLTFLWTFGDGAGATGPTAQHSYAVTGLYNAILTVNDGQGGLDQTSVPIIAGTAVASFPSTAILDDFDRANGGIGGAWVGNTAGLQVVNQAVSQFSPDSWTVWDGAVFGPSQEAYFTIDPLAASAPEHDLMLKVQGLAWSDGHIEVRYDATASMIRVSTYHPGDDWVLHGTAVASLQAGDQLGARANADGTVEVYVNGALLTTVSVASWPYFDQGGRLGMTLVGAGQSRIDNFGGGDVALVPNTAPIATIQSPADGAFYSEGDTIRLIPSATDAEQPSDSLEYHWQVDIHHNVHVHPSSYVFDTREASFIGENHDDGTGISIELTLRVTDGGGLSDTAHAHVYPEIDLEPSAVTVVPDPPNSILPARFQFEIHNRGAMPAPRSRWMLCAGSTVMAQGDTIVAAHDSVAFDLALPPSLGAGGYDLRVVVDSLAAVTETDESNNATTRDLTVVALPLAAGDSRPARLELSGAFPNPSAGPASLALELPRAARVEFAVHDLQGREVWRDLPRAHGPGRWMLEWTGLTANGRRARPGLYLARVSVDGRAITRRIAVVR